MLSLTFASIDDRPASSMKSFDAEHEMRKQCMGTVLLLGLAACASDARWNQFRQTEPTLVEAREFATIDCSGSDECAQRWDRTRQYVARYSATRIRHADAAAIETGRPLEAGVVYLWATRTPAAPGSGRARISLKGMCRGMYGMDGGPGWLYAQCASQIRSIEMNFRGFVLAPAEGCADDAA
ncbi:MULTISPECIES: hypothetical protein [unclassified Caballeronia]|jgi:hypothetical protein|uniref:hypothetical protein n=2 Tax=unclassified Caballeronia TaxID=2646786 RepID=UPI0020287E14|nr:MULTISPECIES: hypothetical protein [unclassified Caballeronia]